MKVKKLKVKIIIALGLLIGIVGYWTMDFADDRALFNSALKIMGPGAFFGAMLSTFFRRKKPYLNVLLICAGVAIGMLSRIFWEIIQNPSLHTYFPFELLIGLAIVLPAAFLGAFLIYFIYWISGEKLTKGKP